MGQKNINGNITKYSNYDILGLQDIQITIEVSDWTNIAKPPFICQATKSIFIPDNAIVELVNDNPIDFQKYGFQLYSASSVYGQVVIIATEKPTASVTLTLYIWR